MNVLASIPRDEAIRPDRIALTTFEAFQVSAPVKDAWTPSSPPSQRTYSLGPVIAETVGEARATALVNWAFSHKQQLIIRETGARGILLHIFAIVKKPDTWVWREHLQVRQERLDTKLLCVIDGGVVA